MHPTHPPKPPNVRVPLALAAVALPFYLAMIADHL